MVLRNVEGKIGAMIILEAIGRPPEHLEETLRDIVTRINNEEGVSVVSQDYKEAQALKERPEFFTTFVEVEVKVDTPLRLGLLVTKYMPVHVDIIYPEKIAITNNDWADVFNEILIRLHRYDEVARVMQMEKGLLENQLRLVLEEKKKAQEMKSESVEDDHKEKKVENLEKKKEDEGSEDKKENESEEN